MTTTATTWPFRNAVDVPLDAGPATLRLLAVALDQINPFDITNHNNVINIHHGNGGNDNNHNNIINNNDPGLPIVQTEFVVTVLAASPTGASASSTTSVSRHQHY